MRENIRDRIYETVFELSEVTPAVFTRPFLNSFLLLLLPLLESII
jgi:hypothetical protein